MHADANSQFSGCYTTYQQITIDIKDNAYHKNSRCLEISSLIFNDVILSTRLRGTLTARESWTIARPDLSSVLCSLMMNTYTVPL